MAQLTRSILHIMALLKFRTTGYIGESFIACSLVLVSSIFAANIHAQDETATLEAPTEATISESISIDWVGPNTKGDVIAVAEVGEKKIINKTPTSRGNPLTVQMPATPGEYELRYVLRQGRTVLATRPITVTAVEVALNAPDQATIGSSVSIDWVGPNTKGDEIVVAEIGEKKTINKTPTSRGNPLTIQMPAQPGEYELRYVLRQGRTVLTTLPISVTAAEVSLNAPDQADIGSSVPVDWFGPNTKGDEIVVAEVGEKKTINKTLTSRGNPLTVQMPAKPGEYELRYVLRQGRTVLTTRPISVTAIEVSLNAPDQAAVGSSVPVDWIGPNTKGDEIVVAEVGEKKTLHRTSASRGNPLTVRMPAKPGEYELRYVLRQGRTVLATRPITVTAAEVTLNAPDEATIGSSLSIDWVGPDVSGDVIAIAKIGEKKTINQTITAQGNPLTVQMPAQPGEYELRYVLRQGRTVLATRPITVTAAEVTLNAPDEATIGSLVSINWVGPDASGDVIAIAKIGENKTISQTITAHGNPLTVQMPAQPGEYELHYVLRQGRTVLATRPITVTKADITLNAPDEAIVGESIDIDWVGGNDNGDIITVAKIGEKKAINSKLTVRGKPNYLTMPTQPGEYELRYILRKGRITLATRPITVNEMILDAPDEARIGETVSVSWVGPNGKSDSIELVETGKRKPSKYGSTRAGSPFSLTMPAQPGEYEIRYVFRQTRTVLATRPITVKAAKIVLDAPDTATVGEPIAVNWQGPDENSDTIEIGKAGDTTRITGNYTHRGSPLMIQPPTKPGEYEIRYVLRQKRTILATRPLTVNAAEIILSAPSEANAGESVSINWTGPDAAGDVIAITKAGEENKIYSAATSRGSPLTVKMPETPGEYEFRYILRQGSTILATRPVTVKEKGGIPNVPLNASFSEYLPIAMMVVVLAFIILPI